MSNLEFVAPKTTSYFPEASVNPGTDFSFVTFLGSTTVSFFLVSFFLKLFLEHL